MNHSGETTMVTAFHIQSMLNTEVSTMPMMIHTTSSAAAGTASDLACRNAKCQMVSPRAAARCHARKCT